jgi:hypothetical protein
MNVDGMPLTQSEEMELSPLLAPYNHVIGEMTANAYNELMRPDHDAETTNLAAAMMSIKAPPTTSALSLSSTSLVPPTGESEMLQLLRAGHIEAPSFLPPFKPSHGKLITRGVYFLTVSVQKLTHNADNDHAHDEYRQLLRIDTPLKMDSVAVKVTPSILKKLGIEVDPTLSDNYSNLRIVKFTLLKPYILFPGSDSNVSLKFVVSQAYIVAENIKTAIVGVGTVPIKNYMVWRRNFSANTGLAVHCSYDDIPAMDDGCRVDLHAKRPANMIPGAHHTASIPAVGENAEVGADASSLTVLPAEPEKKSHYNKKELTAGPVC